MRGSMFSTAYIPHLIYSMALTSVSMHLLRQRKDAESERAQISAQISILEDTAARLRAGEAIPDRELARLVRLASSQREPGGPAGFAHAPSDEQESIGWWEVFLGRKEAAASGPLGMARSEEWDRRDLEKVRKEMQAAR